MRKTLIAFLIAIGAAYFYGLTITYPDLKGYAAILTGTSGALFTIMGIWVAFLYPVLNESLKSPNVISADFSVNGEDTKRLKTVVVVIVISAIVLISSMSLFLISSIMDTEITTKTQEIANRCATSFALLITLCLFYGIYKVILVSLDLVEKFEGSERKRKADRNA